jgi:hypothetical protein
VASQLYDAGREGFLAAEIDWDGAVIKTALVRGYNFSVSHRFVSDVTNAGGTLVAVSGALTNKTISGGVADAADVTFAAVATGAAVPAVVVFQSSAVTGGSDVAASAQRLICYIDTATGLPVTPNGQAINLSWDNGASRIFKL